MESWSGQKLKTGYRVPGIEGHRLKRKMMKAVAVVPVPEPGPDVLIASHCTPQGLVFGLATFE